MHLQQLRVSSPGLAIVRYDMPFLVGVLIGVAFATALGMVVAVPARARGGPAARAGARWRLALARRQDAVRLAVAAGNGTAGWQVTCPSLIRTDKAMAVALLILVVAIAWLIHNVQRSATGARPPRCDRPSRPPPARACRRPR